MNIHLRIIFANYIDSDSPMFEWFNTDITAKEIETSIRKLKTNESPGNDQLINGYFMNSATYLSRTNEPLKNAIPRHIPTSVVQINCINPNSQKRKQHWLQNQFQLIVFITFGRF